MKINKLTLQGFGPFQTKQTIDFSRCNEAGLFRLAGPTGAGKTTILDAIMFALYGETTGSKQADGGADGRTGKDLRCSACGADEETFVELEFEILGTRYQVRRNPEYQRAVKRGDGLTSEPASAELKVFESGDWKLVDGTVRKISKIDAYITRQIGLSAAQFRRVIVIPQGRFREVLISQATDREELLKKLFETHLYEDFEQRVKEEAKKGANRLKELDQQRQGVFAEFDWAKSLDFEAALEETKVRLDEASTRSQRDVDAENGARNEWNQASEQRMRVEADNEKVASRERAAGQLLKAEQRHNEHSELRAELAEAKRVDEVVLAYRDFGRLNERARNAEKDYSKSLEKLQVLEPVMQQAKDSADRARREEGEEGGKLQKALGRLESEIQELEQKRRQRSERERDMRKLEQELAQLRVQYEEAKAEERRSEETLHGVREQLAHAQVAQRRNRAAMVRHEQLQSGAPCPVCGSLDHPQPASVSETLVTDAEIESLQEQVDSARKRVGGACDAAKKLANKIDRSEEACTDLKRSLVEEYSDPTQRLSELDSERRETRAKIDGLTEARKSANEAEERARTEFDAAQRDHAAKEQSNRDLTTEREGKARQLSELLESIAETDAGPLEPRARTREWIQRTEATLRKVDEAMRSAQDRFEDAKQLAEGIVHIEPEPLRAKVAVLQQAYERLREQAAQSRSEKDRLESLNTTATKLRGALVDAEASLGPAQKLADVITGKEGETSISLHAWVLGAYLDEVLSVASRRLVDLTRGRYELRRADDSADGVDRRTRAGLNIEVFDTHLGTSRPARTLSGGETFLASLSMALALAEVASSRGGQALDTVFIDEGFGTLDSETLDLAMDVLTRLRESGRTVGLISHVDELRRRIPAGIEVLKDEARGTATVKQ